MVAGGCVVVGVRAWLQGGMCSCQGGMCGCQGGVCGYRGACVVSGGGVHGCRGHA